MLLPPCEIRVRIQVKFDYITLIHGDTSIQEPKKYHEEKTPLYFVISYNNGEDTSTFQEQIPRSTVTFHTSLNYATYMEILR